MIAVSQRCSCSRSVSPGAARIAAGSSSSRGSSSPSGSAIACSATADGIRSGAQPSPARNRQRTALDSARFARTIAASRPCSALRAAIRRRRATCMRRAGDACAARHPTAERKQHRSSSARGADITPGAAKNQEWRRTRPRAAESAERAKLFWIATVGCGAQQDQSPRSQRKRVHRGVPRAPWRRVMSFVHDHRVPDDCFKRLQRLGSFDEIEGRDIDSRQRPRVYVGGKLRRRTGKPGRRRDRSASAKTGAELGIPLVAQTCRDNNQPPEGFALRPELPQYQSRLDCLAETDGVGDQQARVAVAQHRQGRLELIRQKRDRAGRGRREPAKRIDVRGRCEERSHPAPRPHHFH